MKMEADWGVVSTSQRMPRMAGNQPPEVRRESWHRFSFWAPKKEPTLLNLVFGHLVLELWKNQFLMFYATHFVVLGYGSPRKLTRSPWLARLLAISPASFLTLSPRLPSAPLASWLLITRVELGPQGLCTCFLCLEYSSQIVQDLLSYLPQFSAQMSPLQRDLLWVSYLKQHLLRHSLSPYSALIFFLACITH